MARPATGSDTPAVAPPGLSREVVLLALCGRSPAVISETAWALSRQTPARAPSRVVVLTTGVGRDAIRADLLDSGAWERLRRHTGAAAESLTFGDTGDSIRVFPARSHVTELQDIVTEADNMAAADFILENLRQFTENPATSLVVSVAGGRKSMSVLTALCMTLIGRPADRLCHVLVNPPFDSPGLEPAFLFPDPGVPVYSLTSRDGTVARVAGSEARVALADIPYVRFRELFSRDFARLPGHYSDLVRALSGDLASDFPSPHLHLRLRDCACTVNGTPIVLNPLEFVMYFLLARRRQLRQAPLHGTVDLEEAVRALAAEIDLGMMPRILECRDMLRTKDPDDLRKVASAIGRKLHEALREPRLADACRPVDPDQRGSYGLRLAPERIVAVTE